MAQSMGKQEDRLTTLPDSILIHILSFLPTLDAVRTMLIKRFGTLWTSLPNLELDSSLFDVYHDEDETEMCVPFFTYARNVLTRHSRPKLDSFKVNIYDMYYSDIEARNLGPELTSWIDFALRKQAKVLEFNVGMVEPDEPLYKLPHPEFVSDSLVKLKLEFLEMKLQRRVDMSSLRTLRLIRATVSDDIFREITRGCPLLEEVEIYNCWFDDLNLEGSSVSKLKLDTTEDYAFGHVLRINCPKLQSFEFTGFVECVSVVDLSSLADVTFNLRCRNMEFKEFPEFVAVLKKLLYAKVVKLSCEVVTVLFHSMLKDQPDILVDWERVELDIWLTDKHVTGLNRLLSNSPRLEELVIKVISWHQDFLEAIESELNSQELKGEQCWSFLKRISIHNIANCSYAVLVRLTEMLLKHATALEELVIYYKGDAKSLEFELTSEQLEDFSQKLQTFLKASEHVKILLL